MRAIILAAGLGWRLGEQGRLVPKSLLEFDGQTLLARHFAALEACGIEQVTVGVGYQADKMRHAIAALPTALDAATVFNADYQLGNVVTLWALRDALTYGGPVLLMDADVLYDRRLLRALLDHEADNCFLMDRNFEPGDEPVKLCIRDGVVVEFNKQLPEALRCDLQGESVGFFKLSAAGAATLVARAAQYIERGKSDVMYEAVLRDQVLADPAQFGVADITGLPWIEIDFPEDVRKAATVVLPQLESGGPEGEPATSAISSNVRVEHQDALRTPS